MIRTDEGKLGEGFRVVLIPLSRFKCHYQFETNRRIFPALRRAGATKAGESHFFCVAPPRHRGRNGFSTR
jgi:hypothetical protein